MRKKRTSGKGFVILMILLAICCSGVKAGHYMIDENLKSAKVSDAIPEKKQEEKQEAETAQFDLTEVAAYSGEPYTEVNGNVPFFGSTDYTQESFEEYSNLDQEGRCGVAFANVCQETMPTEERGEIGMVQPTGWHTVKYDGIDGNYLYNRCHLIGYQLTGENANEENLITGTRYMNVEGMLEFENEVAGYVERTGNHVLYRVTPVFEDDNLLASGVLMEASSVEDKGEDLEFCVYCYNVQPDVTIDYATGDSDGPEFTGSSFEEKEKDSGKDEKKQQQKSAGMDEEKNVSSETTYVCNTNTKKFHHPGCGSVKQMATKNMKETNESRESLISQGYDPCQNCNP